MAWLWSKVLLLTTSVAAWPTGPPLTRAPATARPGRTVPVLSLPPMAWLWLNVVPLTVSALELLTAPPAAVASRLPLSWLPAWATLPKNELSVTVTVAKPVKPLRRAPPRALPAEGPLLPSAPRARLLMKSLLEMFTVAVPRFARAPPRAQPGFPVGLLPASPMAWLLDRTSLEMVRFPKFKIAPPELARTGELPLTRTSVIVSPAMVAFALPLMSKTRLALLP